MLRPYRIRVARLVEVVDVDDDVGLFVQENDVAADKKLTAVGRGRGQAVFEFLRARIKLFLQTRRERSVAHELLFETWRQMIFLGESGREMGFALVIPTADFLFVRIVIAIGITIIVVIAMLVVTFAVTVTIAMPIAVAVSVPLCIG